MHMKLCDANVQIYHFQMSQHVKIVLNSQHNIPQVIMRKLGFINRNCGPANHTLCEKEKAVGVLLPLVFISTGNSYV